MSKKILTLFSSVLLKFQSRFTTGFSIQHSLLLSAKKSKKVADYHQTFCAILENFTKAFYFLNHYLLQIAFLIKQIRKNRKRRAKVVHKVLQLFSFGSL